MPPLDPRSLPVTGYIADVWEQPDAIRRTVDGLGAIHGSDRVVAALGEGRYDRVVLTGMGASYHALWPVTLDLIAAGHVAAMVETSELLYYQAALLTPRTLLIAVSQSGRSAETVRLLEQTRPLGLATVGVTNDLLSPLADAATLVVPLDAGREFSVSSKTYLATLAALGVLGAVLTGHRPAPVRHALHEAASVVADYLAAWRDHVVELTAMFADIDSLALVGRGPSLAAVGTGALIMKEAARFPTEGLSAAAFRHGPLEMAGPRLAVLVCEGAATTAALNQNLARELTAAGAQGGLVGPSATCNALRLPEGDPVALPLLEILPAQMASIALAARAGFEPGRFQRATKVTTTE